MNTKAIYEIEDAGIKKHYFSMFLCHDPAPVNVENIYEKVFLQNLQKQDIQESSEMGQIQ